MTNEQKFTTVEERHKAFNRFCKDYECKNCPLMYMGASSNTCVFNWLTLDAEEEKPMPCPFCGSKCEVIGAVNHRVKCSECNYESIMDSDKDAVVAAHNRVCRAVKAFKESEAEK